MWIKTEGREKLKRRKKLELIAVTETACRMDQARPRTKPSHKPGDSHRSGARVVRPHGWQKELPA